MIRFPLAVSLAVVAGALVAFGTSARSAAQGVTLSPDESAERWICRRSADVNGKNATMSDADRTALICRPLRIEMRLSNNATIMRIGSVHAKPVAAAPDVSHALSADQINDAWARFVMQQLGEAPFTGGG